MALNKNNIFFILALSLLLISCGNDKPDASIKSKDTIECIMPIDTLKNIVAIKSEPSEELKQLSALFTETKETPVSLTEKEIDKLEPQYKLKSKEIHLLTDSILLNKLYDGIEYDLLGFYKIDSIKAKGKYKAYVES